MKFSISFLIFSIIAPCVVYFKFSKTIGLALFSALFILALLNFLSKRFRSNFQSFLEKIGGFLGQKLAIIALSIVYFLIFPLKFIMMILKRDRLKLAEHPYWIDFNEIEDIDYERQY